MASAQPQIKTEPTNEAANIISALGKAFKGQNGAPLTGDQLAQWLHKNMAQLSLLVKEGKLTQGQILAVRNRYRLLPLREPKRIALLFYCPFVRRLADTACFVLSLDLFRYSSSKSSPTSIKPPARTPQINRVLPQQRLQRP